MEDRGILVVGPSNGWLFAKKIFDPAEHKKFLNEAGANAAELVMGLNEPQRQESMLSGDPTGLIVTSVHLDGYYADIPKEKQISLAKTICDRHRALAAVAHPVDIPEFFFDDLITVGVPVAIENMDKAKTSGYDPEELWNLMEKHSLVFVEDVQHAYEHGADMRLAWDLFWMGRNRLRYLHVSGQNSADIHALVYKADNRKTVIEFVGKVLSQIQVPIILEGKYDSVEELKTEISFLKKELGFN
jgi:hypothetical protein